jgi:hypothetical protein
MGLGHAGCPVQARRGRRSEALSQDEVALSIRVVPLVGFAVGARVPPVLSAQRASRPDVLEALRHE